MILVENLKFSYPHTTKPVLQNVSFEVNSSECVAIIGPNGCGKTTLSYCISGIFPHIFSHKFEGEITIGDLKVKDGPFEKIIEQIGYIFQNPDNQFVTLRVKDELLFGLENLNVSTSEIESRLAPIIQQFDLNELLNSQPQDLSMGQKQKVALASVLIMHPKILILDEPGSTLDYRGKKNFIEAIKVVKEKGITVLLFSHELSQVQMVADRVIGLKNGGILFNKPVGEVGNKDYRDLYDLDKNNKEISFTTDFKKATPKLEINDLSFKYPRETKRALNNISFNITQNEILGLVGENGSGKTTLLLLIAGLLTPRNGAICFDHKKAHAMNFKELAKFVSIFFQNPDHQIFLPTIQEELSFGMRNLGVSEKTILERIEWAKDFFELDDIDRAPHSFSYGWRQILCLASTVLMDSSVILLDEPELGLDLYFRNKFKKLLRHLHEQYHKIIIVSTHDMELIKEFSGRVIY